MGCNIITNIKVQKPSENFIGRYEEIQEVKNCLEQGKKIALLQRVRGIGKTQE